MLKLVRVEVGMDDKDVSRPDICCTRCLAHNECDAKRPLSLGSSSQRGPRNAAPHFHSALKRREQMKRGTLAPLTSPV